MNKPNCTFDEHFNNYKLSRLDGLFESEYLNKFDRSKPTLHLDRSCHSAAVLGNRYSLNLDKYNIVMEYGIGHPYMTTWYDNRAKICPYLHDGNKCYKGMELNKKIYEDLNIIYTNNDLVNLLTDKHANCGKFCIGYVS